MSDEYLKEKVEGIIEPMVKEILNSLPDDPMNFMYEWLLKNTKSKNGKNEREELEQLRKEVKELRDKKANGQIETKNKKSKQQEESEAHSESSDESEDKDNEEEQKEFERKLQEQRNKVMKRGQRSSVSAEAFGMFNKKGAFKPRVIPKKPEQIETIKKKISQSFIFNALDDQDMQTVLLAFEEKKYKAGDYVITQGEQGDVIYLVDIGELDCEKVFKKGDPPTYLKTYYPGESFGELVLLYNAPRAASIKAKIDCVLWALDRGTFNNIVKEAAIKKRNRYEETLKKIPILSTVDSYELSQICDAIKSEKVAKGDFIIRQGEQGDKFYILDEGDAYAAKVFKEGEEAKNVKDYKNGDYFGELALLSNQPRAASIIAKTDCKLLSLDRLAFKRLLGPLEKILKRNSEIYAIYNKQFK